MELRRRQRDRNHACGDRAAWSDAPTLDPRDRLPEDILIGDRGSQMPIGTVKWFNAQKGFGFIQPVTDRRTYLFTSPLSNDQGLEG
jgi:'Cold-shock' DNA-binding domain